MQSELPKGWRREIQESGYVFVFNEDNIQVCGAQQKGKRPHNKIVYGGNGRCRLHGGRAYRSKGD